MKLLLTSGGLKNKAIIDAFELLAGKNLRETSAVYIPTAANPERGDKGWLIANLNELHTQCRAVDIIDIALPTQYWEPAVRAAESIIVGGGNTTYLMKEMRTSGFDRLLSELLATKIYVGISAGSIVATPSTAPISDNEPAMPALGLVQFGIQPHYLSASFALAASEDKVRQRIADATIPYPVYALDDQSAICVNGADVHVASAGKWKLFS